MKKMRSLFLESFLFCVFLSFAYAEPLIIAKDGKTTAKILVDAEAEVQAFTKKGKQDIPSTRYGEWKAANDLSVYIEKMSGAKPEVITEPAAIQSALSGSEPVFIVGALALQTQPALKQVLEKTMRPTKVFDAEAIVLKRDGNKVFLAGTTDASHYFAVSTLLQNWGCRWYMPTAFGEVIPHHTELTIDALDTAYAPPFEMRDYWLNGNASREGNTDFQLRNFMNGRRISGYSGSKAFKEALVSLNPQRFNLALHTPETATQAAGLLEEKFAMGEPVFLSFVDRIYQNDFAQDAEINANLQDKYFLSQDMTDAMWSFTNQLAAELKKRHPESKAYIGLRAYVNTVIPPQRNLPADPSVVVALTPNDIDPNHAITDERSPSRNEYGEMVKCWAEITQGKLAIQDYDQTMLLWRDLPNPTHRVFRKDVRFYRDLGILGVSPESRGAYVTTWLNAFFRGQLMWNPDSDSDSLLEEFYKNFYGKLAAPMRDYWTQIYEAWENTLVTEHEYYLIPAIYTRELVEKLRISINEAKKIASQGLGDEFKERLAVTEHSFRLIDLYTGMWQMAATEGDYQKAEQLGREMLKERIALAEINPILTTAVVGKGAEASEPKEGVSPALLAGEIQQYIELKELTDGTKGKLLARLPKEWAFRRDPNDTGLASGFARQTADLSYWETNQEKFVMFEQKKMYPTTRWETIQADLYAQAQGILHPDGQSFTGYLWYKNAVSVAPSELLSPIHIRFPGLFGEAWLYINGELIAHHQQDPLWWNTDYSFDWDADISGKLREGKNDITLRIYNPHHMGGIFRRPFIYQPTGGGHR